MKRILLSICLACFAILTMADVRVTLNDGTVVEGEILVDNSDILIVKDAKGRRYQYPPSIVKSKEEIVIVVEEETVEKKRTKVGFVIAVSEGVSFLPPYESMELTSGSTTNIDILIGAKDLLDKPIFLGGGIGWNGHFYSDKTVDPAVASQANFIPLKLYAKVPLLMESAHAPALTAGLGYGFAIKNKSDVTQGGLFAEFGLGWNYTFKKNKSIYLGLHSTFQQCQMKINSLVESNAYVENVGRCYTTVGLRFALTL